ncbi:hypothetical protein N8D74_00660 [Curtobacterium flaccumfaciens]|uniref:Uncharacterized protein n=1 Tax=Curtobacterium poinsettiae TaxID=159612 RepID=A0A9Q9P847_9MICO|nr:hypothetical protein [Curtobacterium flaccumfaciens]UXN25438.1 hypothetical protein N8D74_00660 [Curtobacterium flaccumfaciens]UYC80276.1 hypothetical protein OE229_14230 [Curtobacterium flaccumfaciens pv. poinsettiae]
MTKDAPGVFRHMGLLESVLRRAGNDRVVVDAQKVQHGDLETVQRFAVSDGSVVEWRRGRGTGALTGTRFESAADAELWIVADACGYLREAHGLPIAHWLLERRDELPSGMSLSVEDNRNLLGWTVREVSHRAWFGGGPVPLPQSSRRVNTCIRGSALWKPPHPQAGLTAHPRVASSRSPRCHLRIVFAAEVVVGAAAGACSRERVLERCCRRRCG